MEELLLVRREEDAALAVPGQLRKADASVGALNYGDVASIELLDIVAPGIDKVLTALAVGLVDGAIGTVQKLEGWQNRVELDLLLGEDAEFVLGAGVELDVQEVLPVLELVLLGHKELLVLQIVDRDVEVGEATNDYQVISIS